jgi:hypothetical protein
MNSWQSSTCWAKPATLAQLAAAWQELAEQVSDADVETLAFERTVEFLHDPAA